MDPYSHSLFQVSQENLDYFQARYPGYAVFPRHQNDPDRAALLDTYGLGEFELMHHSRVSSYNVIIPSEYRIDYAFVRDTSYKKAIGHITLLESYNIIDKGSRQQAIMDMLGGMFEQNWGRHMPKGQAQ